MTLNRFYPSGAARWLVAFIAIHSCILGCAILFAPNAILSSFGFAPQDPFFPSQTGVFMLILGICYLASLKIPQLILVLLISKAAAVLFLMIHAVFLEAPLVVWLAAAGDASMLGALLLTLRFRCNALDPGAPARGSVPGEGARLSSADAGESTLESRRN